MIIVHARLIIVQAWNMIIIHARTMIVVHPCTMINSTCINCEHSTCTTMIIVFVWSYESTCIYYTIIIHACTMHGHSERATASDRATERSSDRAPACDRATDRSINRTMVLKKVILKYRCFTLPNMSVHWARAIERSRDWASERSKCEMRMKKEFIIEVRAPEVHSTLRLMHRGSFYKTSVPNICLIRNLFNNWSNLLQNLAPDHVLGWCLSNRYEKALLASHRRRVDSHTCMQAVLKK